MGRVAVESTILETQVGRFSNSTIHEQTEMKTQMGRAVLVLAQVSTMAFDIPFCQEN